MIFIKREFIKSEFDKHYKPLALEATAQSLPFNELGNRGFEILVYRLFKRNSLLKKFIEYSKAELMEGIADRGRDICLLDTTNKLLGVVQCKNYKDAITKPALIKEILKFALFLIIEAEEIQITHYFIVIPPGVNSKAKDLIRNFEENIKSENIEDLFLKVKEDYIAFQEIEYQIIEADLLAIINNLTVIEINGIDLTEELYIQNDVLINHFKVINIISVEKAGEIVEEKLTKFGLKMLTDKDLKLLQDRIGSLPDDKRIKFLGVDLYGYPQKAIIMHKDRIIKALQKIIHARGEINKIMIDYINEEIQIKVLIKVTNKFLKQEIIHPFSVQLANPYIFKMCSGSLISKQLNC